MPNTLNTAGRIIGVISQQIDKNTKSGAGIDYTYGQILGIEDGYRSAILSLSPSNFWRLADIITTGFKDEVLTTNFGTVTGSVTMGVTGALPNDPNKAITFGVGSYINVPSHANFNFGDGALSISVWVKRSLFTNNDGIVSRGTGGYYLRLNDQNKIEFLKSNVAGGLAVSSNTITDTNWHFIVFTRAADHTMHIYCDGVEVTATTDTTVSLLSPTNPLYIGNDESTGEYFHGKLDELALYGRELTPSEANFLWESRNLMVGTASVYIAGSRELAASDGGVAESSTGFFVPSFLSVSASDYVRVSLDSRGHKRVEDVVPTSYYSKVNLNPNTGYINLGDGTSDYLQRLIYDKFSDAVTLSNNTGSNQTAFIVETIGGQQGKIQVRQIGDTTSRISIQGDSSFIGIEAGPGGSTARDTKWWRQAADVWKTDDQVIIVGPVTTTWGFGSTPRSVEIDSAATSFQTQLMFRVAGTEKGLIRADGSGNIVVSGNGAGGTTFLAWDGGTGGVIFGDGAAGQVLKVSSSGVITFGAGGDTNVYRYTADVLKTDDIFWSNGGIKITSPGTADGQNFEAIRILLPNNGYVGLALYQSPTDTQAVFKFNGSGQLSIGPGGSTAPLQVLGTRKTGWTAATGTAQRGTFATDTVTLVNLARAVKALEDDLISHGIIGT